MTMKVTKKELIKIWNTLEGLSNTQLNRRFSYGIVRNKKILKDEIESLQEAQTPGKDYQQYNIERITLCELLADKDEDGQAVHENGEYVFTENRAELDEKMKELVAKNKECIDDFQQKEKEFSSILAEEVELEVYKMSLDVFPETIEPTVLEVLDDFISEE
jgi:hypothetical protein